MPQPQLVRLRLGNTRLLVPKDDPRLFYETLVMNGYGSARLKPGDVVVDVGANIGDYTVRAAQEVGPLGKVVAIEPNPCWFSILMENLHENALQNVTPLNCAISDREGRQSFVGDVMTQVQPKPSSGFRYSAETRTLDSVLADCKIDHVDVLKMDIEGGERFALRDLRSLASIRQIVMEIHGTATLEELSELLSRSGFVITRYNVKTMAFETAQSILSHLPTFLMSDAKTNYFGTRRILSFLLFGERVMVADPSQFELNLVHCQRVRAS